MFEQANAPQPWINPGAQALSVTITAPRGPADKVVDALNALAVAVKEARASGWAVQFGLSDEELSVEVRKTLSVLKPAQP